MQPCTILCLISWELILHVSIILAPSLMVYIYECEHYIQQIFCLRCLHFHPQLQTVASAYISLVKMIQVSEKSMPRCLLIPISTAAQQAADSVLHIVFALCQSKHVPANKPPPWLHKPTAQTYQRLDILYVVEGTHALFALLRACWDTSITMMTVQQFSMHSNCPTWIYPVTQSFQVSK